MNSSEDRSTGSLTLRRSLRAALLSVALLAVASAFLARGALPAVSLLVAASAIYFVFRGLPETLVTVAGRRRGGSYLRLMSLIVPIGMLLLSAYIAAIFIFVLQSDLPVGFPLEVPFALSALSGLLNLVIAAVNLISPEGG